MATYLFDFDGTLVDSMPTYIEAFSRILRRFDIPAGRDFVKTITPLGYGGTARYILTMGVPMTEEEIVRDVGAFTLGAYTNEIVAKPHVKETLEALRARGDDLHVLTASPHLTLDPCLKRNGLYDLFLNVWSCEDFGTTKADPAIYRMAAERIGKPVSEIIFSMTIMMRTRRRRAPVCAFTVCLMNRRAILPMISAPSPTAISPIFRSFWKGKLSK